MTKVILLTLILLGCAGPSFAKMQQTTWRPDTCDCEVVYEWDDAVPADHRVHTFKSISKPEEYYEDNNIKGQAQYNALVQENQLKNKVEAEILKSVPAATAELTNRDGTKEKEVKDFKFSFDANRKLVVSADGLTAQDKATIEAAVGAGKVEISE